MKLIHILYVDFSLQAHMHNIKDFYFLLGSAEHIENSPLFSYILFSLVIGGKFKLTFITFKKKKNPLNYLQQKWAGGEAYWDFSREQDPLSKTKPLMNKTRRWQKKNIYKFPTFYSYYVRGNMNSHRKHQLAERQCSSTSSHIILEYRWHRHVCVAHNLQGSH